MKKREDDFEVRRKHLQELSDDELKDSRTNDRTW